MTLRWVPDGLTGQALRGMDDAGRYLGQVVHYDLPASWRGYVRGYPITGRFTTDEEARAAVEGVVSRSQQPGPGRAEAPRPEARGGSGGPLTRAAADPTMLVPGCGGRTLSESSKWL